MTTRRIAASGGTDRLPPNGNTPLTTKGDLYTYSTTQARLAVGNDGETLVADSAASTGLRWQGNFAAGKNKIINGDFGIWQRGTSFTSSDIYTSDRWYHTRDGSGVAVTISRQTFTAGTAPIAGYEGQFFYRFNQTTAGTGSTYSAIQQQIEDVRTFAGQTVTVSFWAKADASRSVPVNLVQIFGTGGSSTVATSAGTASVTTSWARYTFTVAVPSISGATIGTNSLLRLQLSLPFNVVQTIDFWGVQVEAGSVATAFQTATGTLAGELAACQRYYIQYNSNGTYGTISYAAPFSTTQATCLVQTPVSMRTIPTSVNYANLQLLRDGSGAWNITVLAVQSGESTNNTVVVGATIGTSSLTVGALTKLVGASSSGFMALSAEL